jgi:hypothetical protein
MVLLATMNRRDVKISKMIFMYKGRFQDETLEGSTRQMEHNCGHFIA